MNPEFRRLLITEFQGHRLVALPTVLAAVFGLSFYANDYSFGPTSAFLATLGYFALVFVWGTRQAADSVIHEINIKTWPTQRMSALGAWRMAWAKLAGSTSFTWAGGLVCMAVYAMGNAEWWDAERIAVSVLLYIGSGLFAQCVCFLISLIAIQRRREFGRVQVVSYQFLGLLFALPPLYIGLSVTGGVGLLDLTVWYGMDLALPQFMLVFLGTFVLWALAGVWWLMRVELQEHPGPWLWLAFVMFVMAFFGGLRGVPVNPNLPLELLDLPHVPSVVLTVGVILCYALALFEPKNRLRLRQLATAWRARDRERVGAFVPRSALALPLVAAGTVIAIVGFKDYTAARGEYLHLIYTATLLFLIRDIAIIYWICMGRADGRGEAVAAVILVLLYTLVPGLLSFAAPGSQGELGWLGAVFSPHAGMPSVWTVIAPALQAVAMGGLVWRRWQGVITAKAAAGPD